MKEELVLQLYIAEVNELVEILVLGLQPTPYQMEPLRSVIDQITTMAVTLEPSDATRKSCDKLTAIIKGM